MNKSTFEEFVERLLRGAFALGALLATPFVVAAGLIERVVASLRDLAVRVLPVDPFRLRRHGDTGLSSAVKLDLAAYTALLGMSLSFELFAWGSVWGFVGDTARTGFWGVVLAVVLMINPFAFAGMVILLDRGVLMMDDPSNGKRLHVIAARVSMLLVLALITAVPVELWMFRSEIDTVIENAEKVQVDVIREKARAYETALAEDQKGASAVFVTSQPDDVVARRKDERSAIVSQQKSDRAEISRRLDKKGGEAVREAAGRGVSGRRSNGVTTAVVRKQESEIRQELKDFDKAAREQLASFDGETERMRSEAATKGVEEIARRDTALTEKLQDIEAMPAYELAAAYGGEYKQPNGFLARYRILLTLVEQDGKNRAIVWGCRLVMVAFGLAVLGVKYTMTNPDTRDYFSLRAQAQNGNEDAVRVFISRALNDSKDAEAIGLLRSVARESEAARTALAKLGYDANVETASWSPEVLRLHERIGVAYATLDESLVAFRDEFRQLCRRRDDRKALTRDQLTEAAERIWNGSVAHRMNDLDVIETNFRHVGSRIPGWPAHLSERDPRTYSRLWMLSDAELVEQFGWAAPQGDLFRTTPEA